MAKPIGPYSPAVAAGGWWVSSGQLGLLATSDGPRLADGFEAQVDQALANLAGLLHDDGLGWPDVVKVTVFLVDMANFGRFNERYATALDGHRPARSVVGVAALPLGAEVEIEAWARRS